MIGILKDSKTVIAIGILGLMLFSQAAYAKIPLNLIAVFKSDSAGALLLVGCMSPGDLNGDGYSELFAAERSGPRRLFVYSGGNPPDSLPDKDFGFCETTAYWFSDINGDGFKDFGIRRPKKDSLDTVEIWFGGKNFMTKSKPDLVITHPATYSSFFGQSIYSGDVNGDGQNDLIIADPNPEELPLDGYFYIYYGGTLLDNILDDSINIYYTHHNYNDFFIGTALGDINDDGLVDYGYSGLGVSGYIAIILGSMPLDSIPDFLIWSPTGSRTFGEEIVPVGDINQDCYDDFMVGGQSSRACLFYGGNPFDTIPKILSNAGEAFANIGDINHDGWDDIAVGTPDENFATGKVSIYFGAYDMDTIVDLTLRGEEAYPYCGGDFGKWVGPAGDFNGDGVDDVVISAFQYYQAGRWDHGMVYVYAGSDSLPTPAEDEAAPLPIRYNLLEQNYPNPFNSQTVIEYYLWGEFEREVDLSVYNILGQKIRTLRGGLQSGGKHTIFWDGRDGFGRPLSSGLYFYKLQSGEEELCRKMLYLK